MDYNLENLKSKTLDIENWLKKEFSNIRTGLASTAILDKVRVESYGALTPIDQVASITTEDAKTIRIKPWDASQVQAIEKAVTGSDLGVSVAVDDKGIRLSFPELTSERRQDFVKIAKDKLEQAKISLRGERDEIWGDIQVKEKEGEISQDDKFKLKDDMQKIIDDSGSVFVSLFEKKEEEIKG
jgi:ribosome recycling factor